jgi:hypothetical protein
MVERRQREAAVLAVPIVRQAIVALVSPTVAPMNCPRLARRCPRCCWLARLFPNCWIAPVPVAGMALRRWGMDPYFQRGGSCNIYRTYSLIYLTMYTLALYSTHITLTLSSSGNQVLLRTLGQIGYESHAYYLCMSQCSKKIRSVLESPLQTCYHCVIVDSDIFLH